MLAVGVPEIALAAPPASTKFPWLGEITSTGTSFTSVTVTVTDFSTVSAPSSVTTTVKV